MTIIAPGALVRYREREWVVLPSDDPELVLLRAIGSAREVCGVVKPLADLMSYETPHERIEPAQFPLPSPEDVQDHAAVRLLLESARLLLRDGGIGYRLPPPRLGEHCEEVLAEVGSASDEVARLRATGVV